MQWLDTSWFEGPMAQFLRLPYFALPILLTREQCSEVPLREFHSGLTICEHVSSLIPRELAPSFFSTHLLTREQCSEVPLREFHSGLSICEHVSRLFPREPCSELSTHHGISTVHHHHDADHRHHPF